MQAQQALLPQDTLQQANCSLTVPDVVPHVRALTVPHALCQSSTVLHRVTGPWKQAVREQCTAT